MGGTRSRFEQSRINVGEILDLENPAGYTRIIIRIYPYRISVASPLLTRISTVLGKSTVHCHTMSLEVLAEQFISTAAVEALPAELRVVCNDPVANGEPLHLRAKTCNNTDGFVACGLLEKFTTRFTPVSSNVA